MPISDIINIQITTSVQGLTRQGFGVPLILSCNAAWVERVRSYTSIAAVAADFAVTTPEYLAAAAFFSQNPKIPLLKIGRLANKPTQRWAITPIAVASTAYTINNGSATAGTAATYTSGGAPVVADITAGLLAAFNALTDTCTATDQTTFLRITGNTAGAWNDVYVSVAQTSLMKIMQDHADPGVAADLTAINTEDSDWYVIVNPWNSALMALGIAAWAESNSKLFMCSTQDSEVITVATGGATDVAETAKDSAYDYTSIHYHNQISEWLAEALSGRCLPLDPGSETWALKVLPGVLTMPLTGTHITNIKAKNANSYYTVSGLNITFDGKVASGEYIDVIRFLDWFKARLGEDLLALLVDANKIPFTDQGIAQVESVCRAILSQGIEAGGIAESPAPTVIVPLASSISDADKAARKLTGVEITFTLAGAIHKVDPITVLVST